MLARLARAAPGLRALRAALPRPPRRTKPCSIHLCGRALAHQIALGTLHGCIAKSVCARKIVPGIKSFANLSRKLGVGARKCERKVYYVAARKSDPGLLAAQPWACRSVRRDPFPGMVWRRSAAGRQPSMVWRSPGRRTIPARERMLH